MACLYISGCNEARLQVDVVEGDELLKVDDLDVSTVGLSGLRVLLDGLSQQTVTVKRNNEEIVLYRNK